MLLITNSITYIIKYLNTHNNNNTNNINNKYK